jgi:hypothetical protein
MAEVHGPIQISLAGPSGAFVGRAPTLVDAITNLQSGPQFFRTLVPKLIGEQPRELFPGAVLLANVAAGLGVGFAGIPGAISSVATQASNYVEQIQGGGNVALNIGNLLSGLGSIAGGISGANVTGFTQPLSQLLNVGGVVASAFAPAPTQAVSMQPTSFGPAYNPYQVQSFPNPVTRTMASVPMISGAVSMLTAITRPLLQKMAATLGRKGLSLSQGLSIIKRLGKIFTSPEAIALYVGLTVSEMASLITANAARKRRRMNPANTNALRRSLRRLKSFDRLSHRVSAQLGRAGRRGGRSRAVARCGSCRKSPCAC